MEVKLQKIHADALQKIIDFERQIGQLKFSLWSKKPQLRIVDDEGGNWTPRLIVILAAKDLSLLMLIQEIEERMQNHLLTATDK